MPKINISSAPKSSAMPEMKTAPSKSHYGQGLNATVYHHSGTVRNSTKITSTKKIETPRRIEIRTETEFFEETSSSPANSTAEKPLKIEVNDFSSEERLDMRNNEPDLIENIDNFEEEKKEGEFDMKFKQPKSNKDKKNKKGIIIFSIISFALFLLSATALFVAIVPNQILPLKILVPALTAASLLATFFALFTFLRKFKTVVKIICSVFEILLTAVLIIIFIYLNNTYNFLSLIQAGEYQIESFYVIVKNNSEFEKSEDLNGKVIATYNDISKSYQEALEEFSKKSTAEQSSYPDFVDAGTALLENSTDAILLKGSMKEVLNDIVADFNNNTKIIDTIEIKTKIETSTADSIDISHEPFSIFISGIDTYGDISTVSRSDVNMIATINPKEHKILLTSIPRDYYVQLHETVGLRDKLTHAGIYGVDMSRQTIEDLFETEIPFYIRVNFSTVLGVVDAIGGITINSDMPLSLAPSGEYGKYCYFSQGENFVDGDCALRFARERYSYAEGDRHRVQNQQEVLTAIINKVSSSKTLIMNYNDLLASLGGSIQTNVPTSQIYKLVNLQLDEMPSWSIDRISVDGIGSMDYTYSIPSQSLYVMIPDETTVNNAKRKIRETLGLEVEPEPGSEELIPEEETISEE